MNEKKPASWRKTAALALVIVIAAPIGWLFLINLALWTGGVSALVSGDHDLARVKMRHGWAWTVWPTYVHVNDFELKIDGYSFQLQVEVPQGEIEIALDQLFNRHFVARSIYARNIRAIVHTKTEDFDVESERYRAFGPIEGFDPPVRKGERPTPRAPEKMVKIDLESINATLSELWFNEYRVVMDQSGTLAAGLHIHPGYTLEVKKANLDFEAANLFVRDEQVVSQLDGSIAAIMQPVHPGKTSASTALAGLDAQLKLQGTVADLSFAQMYLPESSKVTIAKGGAGPFSLDVQFKNGVFADGSQFNYNTKLFRMAARKNRVSGAVDVQAKIESAEKQVAANIDVKLVSVRVYGPHDDRDDSAALSAPSAELAVRLNEVKKGESGEEKEWKLRTLVFSLPKLEIHRLQALDGVGKNPETQGGSAVLGLRTTLVGSNRLKHHIKLTADKLALRAKDMTLRLSGKVEGEALSGMSLAQGEIPSFKGHFDDISIRSPNGTSEGTWLQIDAANGEWKRQGGAFEFKMSGQIEDLRPVITHADQRERLIERIPDLDVARAFSYSLAFKREPGGQLDVQIFHLTRPSLHLSGLITFDNQDMRAAFRLKNGLGITLERQAKQRRNVQWYAGKTDAWLQGQRPWVTQIKGENSPEK